MFFIDGRRDKSRRGRHERPRHVGIFMKPTLVTGASGFVGWHVARLLIGRGHRVRALVRPGSRVHELEVETASGDLRNIESLQRAVEGCGLVFHVAADYRLWAKNPRELYNSNVDGTQNLLTAARRAGVERVVYTSTVGCIGMPSGELGDEAAPVGLVEMKGAYKRSKFLAEQAALKFAADGFPVVIVNPTAPLGDHDFKPTPTGKIVLDFLNGNMPAFVDTGLNVVDVRDAAMGHLLAAELGRPGERYILGGENLTLREILECLSRLTDRKAPTVQIPHFVALGAALASTAWGRVSGREPRVPLDAVRMARKKMWVSNHKAITELGFRPGPAGDALGRAVAWFQDGFRAAAGYPS